MPVHAPTPWIPTPLSAHLATAPRLGQGARIVVVEGPPEVRPGLPAWVSEPIFGHAGHWPEHAADTAALLIHPDGLVPEARVRFASPFVDGTYDPASTLGWLGVVVMPGDIVLVMIQVEVDGLDDLPADREPILARRLDAIAARGALVLLPAGNGGHRLTERGPHRRVGALGRDGRPLAGTNHGPGVDLAAPGVDVAIPGTSRVASGTSVSAALATGIAAAWIDAPATERDAAWHRLATGSGEAAA